MAPAQLCFIISEPTTLSKADQQRRRMKALSHAAIVSYTRRNPANKGWAQIATAPSFASLAKSRKKSPDKQTGGSNGPPEVTDGEQKSQKPDLERNNPESSPAHAGHGWMSTAIYEELDPFLKTAFPLSSHERSLLHQCEIPHYKVLLPTC